MAGHPNAELFQRGYSAFQAGDLDIVRSLFAPDIVWHVQGRNHLSGDKRGVDDVLAFFMRQFEETNGTLKVEVHDILANDEHAVALATFSAQKDGKSLINDYTHAVHIKGGKLTESWIFAQDPYAVDDFWG